MNSRLALRRAGLTLMELVVVMVILIALAGILLPLFPSMLNRGHTSSAATNMTELSKAVQTYINQGTPRLPNNLDNIAAIVGQTNPATGLPIVAVTSGTSATFAATDPDIGVAALSTNDASMLNAGYMMTALTTMVPTSASSVGAWTPTYNPYSTTAVGASFLPQNLSTGTPAGASAPLAAGTNVVYVSPYAVARELGAPTTLTTAAGVSTGVSTLTTAKYVLFGVGDYSSLSQTVLQQAPIHFDDAAAGEPNVAYCRFGLVFQTTADGTYTDFAQARFVGTVDLGDSTISSAADHVQAYLNTK